MVEHQNKVCGIICSQRNYLRAYGIRCYVEYHLYGGCISNKGRHGELCNLFTPTNRAWSPHATIHKSNPQSKIPCSPSMPPASMYTLRPPLTLRRSPSSPTPVGLRLLESCASAHVPLFFGKLRNESSPITCSTANFAEHRRAPPDRAGHRPTQSPHRRDSKFDFLWIPGVCHQIPIIQAHSLLVDWFTLNAWCYRVTLLHCCAGGRMAHSTKARKR